MLKIGPKLLKNAPIGKSWFEHVQIGSNQAKLVQIGPNLVQMDLNGPELVQIRFKWVQMGLGSSRSIAKIGPNRSKVALIFKWVQIGPNRSKLVRISPNWFELVQ